MQSRLLKVLFVLMSCVRSFFFSLQLCSVSESTPQSSTGFLFCPFSHSEWGCSFHGSHFHPGGVNIPTHHSSAAFSSLLSMLWTGVSSNSPCWSYSLHIQTKLRVFPFLSSQTLPRCHLISTLGLTRSIFLSHLRPFTAVLSSA